MINSVSTPEKKVAVETFPHSLKNWLRSCPRSGTGMTVHKYIYNTALKLHRYCPDTDQKARLIIEATANCGREVPTCEIEDAICNSEQWIENSRGKIQSYRRWPLSDVQRIKAILSEGGSLAELSALSPVKWNDEATHTEEVIDRLFPGNPLLCAGPSLKCSITRTREEWRGRLDRLQFIVPSPMSGRVGITKKGSRSMRTSMNTGPRRFLIVEFDSGTFDEHAALLYHLAKFAPLVLAVHSGRRSSHGWFFCERKPAATVEIFFRYAVSLGADAATWTPSQLVRLPDGQRDNGQRQRILFFNPNPLESHEAN